MTCTPSVAVYTATHCAAVTSHALPYTGLDLTFAVVGAVAVGLLGALLRRATRP